MKKINILLLCVAVGLSSCNPLDMDPTNTIVEDQFWANPQLSRSFVNQFYLWAPCGANQYYQAEQWSDNAVGNTDRDQNTFRQLDFNNRLYDELNGPGVIGAPWGGAFKNIRQANLGIERIPEVPDIVEEEMHQLLAECFAFRAQFFFDLERYWGVFPLITHTMGIFDETMLPQNSREEIFDQILSDYDTALEHYTHVTKKPTIGLLNQEAVQVLKSRAALTAACAAEASAKGVYDKLGGSEDAKALYKFSKEAKHYYQIAYDAAKSVIGKYKLEPEYADLFNQTTEGHLSVESIWPVMFNETNRSGFNPASHAHPVGRMYGATTDFSPDWIWTGGTYPTQDLVDCYYQKDEATGKWMQWWKTSQAKAMDVKEMANGLLAGKSENYQDMYKNRDKRFYATILYDGAYYAGQEGVEMYKVGTWIDYSKPAYSEKFSALHTVFHNSEKLEVGSSGKMTMTGYYSAKYVPGQFKEDGTQDDRQPSISYFMVRYAEVLLNYAEAAYKLGGKEVEVLDAVNQIRHRAGLDDFDASVVGHDLWEEYKLQRRVEFAFEVPAHRYFDLLRWGEADGKTGIEELNRPSNAMFIFRKGIESQEVEENGYPAPKTDPKYFTPYFEVRPIENTYYERKFDEAVYYKLPYPRTTLENNKNFKQNPGWENRSYQ